MQDCHSGLHESYMEEEMQNRQSFEVASQGGKNTDHADAPSAQQRVAVAPFSRDLLPQPRLSVAFFLLYLVLATTKRLRQQFVSVSERKRLVAAGVSPCLRGLRLFLICLEVIRKYFARMRVSPNLHFS